MPIRLGTLGLEVGELLACHLMPFSPSLAMVTKIRTDLHKQSCLP